MDVTHVGSNWHCRFRGTKERNWNDYNLGLGGGGGGLCNGTQTYAQLVLVSIHSEAGVHEPGTQTFEERVPDS